MFVNPNGLLISSILAKKLAVSASHLVIDMPVGKQCKLKNYQDAHRLKKRFEQICKLLKIKVAVLTADGSQPIGNGIGPSLEARDVLWILQRDVRAPKDLEAKALRFAAALLELAGVKNSKEKAKELLASGAAYKKMKQIIKSQEGNPNIQPGKLPVGKHKVKILARKTGTVQEIDNKRIAKLARIAGSPLDKGSGLYLHKKIGDTVTRREALFTLYAQSEAKFKFAEEQANENHGYVIQ